MPIIDRYSSERAEMCIEERKCFISLQILPEQMQDDNAFDEHDEVKVLDPPTIEWVYHSGVGRAVPVLPRYVR